MTSESIKPRIVCRQKLTPAIHILRKSTENQVEIHRRLLELLLCHADARQVFDLPEGPVVISRSMTASQWSETMRSGAFNGKSKTCRVSAWRSQPFGSSLWLRL